MLCAVLFVPATYAESPDVMPTLEHFSVEQIDKSLDPCSDFFEYACAKWNKANPIPADQPSSGTFNNLVIWNVAAERNALEEAAKASHPTPVQQQVGDYYAACMDESAVEKAGVSPLQPTLDRIARMEKTQLPEVIASIHQMIRPANLNFIDAEYPGVLFGLYSIPDYNDAQKTLAALDQSGMDLPGREFYLNDDDKSKHIRELFVQHVTKML